MATAGKEATKELTRAQKAAVIVSALDLESASAIVKSLPELEMEELTRAISEVRTMSEDVKSKAITEFNTQMRAGGGGGTAMVELGALLEKSIGKQRAETIMTRIQETKVEGKFFEYLNDMDPQQVVVILRQERPQTLALIFCHIDPKRAAEILSVFDPDLQAQVIMRIGRTDRVSPEIVSKVEMVLRKKLSGVQSGKLRVTGGPKVIAQVLNHVDRGTEKRIFEGLQAKDANLLDDIKKLMLVFEDLASLPDSAAQFVLREVDMNDLVLALKGASVAMKELIFRNLSARAAERLKEEIELMGPKPKSEVEGAQQRVVAVVRRLEEEGKIQSARGGKGEELVA